ncbi:MAG: phosphate ABC transporter permease PstA [Actinobacteria bacterium]|nr:MAG: phosphate ABC transporter permease PstA [Actinomycetota bacterium]
MAAVEPGISLRGGGRVRRRKVVNRIAEAVALVAALLAIFVLGIVVWSVAKRGAGELSWNFLTKDLPIPFSPDKGGIAPLLVGSAVLVGLAAAMAVPFGVAIALYLEEFASPRVAPAIQLSVDLLNGLPSIVIGVFIFGVFVYGHLQNGWAGSIGLAIVMLPLITRATQEVLRLVPRGYREAALALGASRWRTVLGIILPSSLGGILTGSVLAIARAVGETAPLLFVTSIYGRSVAWNPLHALPNAPVQIFIWSESEDPADHQRAWATALVLMLFVLITSLVARLALARTRSKLGR